MGIYGLCFSQSQDKENKYLRFMKRPTINGKYSSSTNKNGVFYDTELSGDKPLIMRTSLYLTPNTDQQWEPHIW